MYNIAQLENRSNYVPLIKHSLNLIAFVLLTMATIGLSSIALKSSVILLLVSETLTLSLDANHTLSVLNLSVCNIFHRDRYRDFSGRNSHAF